MITNKRFETAFPTIERSPCPRSDDETATSNVQILINLPTFLNFIFSAIM